MYVYVKMCACEHVRVHECEYMFACVSVSVCLHVCTCACVHAWIACTRKFVHFGLRVCMYICMRVYARECAYACIRVHVFVCMYGCEFVVGLSAYQITNLLIAHIY